MVLIRLGLLTLLFALAAQSGALPSRAPIPETVPAPWTPVRSEGERIRCWGREHRIAGPLPRQIRSQGKELLAGAIHLRRDGELKLQWDTGLRSGSSRAVEWSSTSAGGQPGVSARSRVEYDGFWDVEITVASGPVRELSLEIPLASRRARYLHFVNETHYQEQNTLGLPDKAGLLWSNRFGCQAWIGDERVGLAWCADTDAPFRLKQADRALSITRAGETTTLRITLVDHPVVLREPLRWRFGLIATPVRPLPAGWRDWRLNPGASANTHILWWNAWAGGHADLEPKDPEAFRAQAAQIRGSGQHLLPYAALLALAAQSEDYVRRGNRWRREPFSSLQDEGTPYWIMCPQTEWQRYFPARAERLVRDFGVNGLYLDFTFPYLCTAAHHPCGWTDAEGHRKGEFRIFALRKLAQDTYERVKRADPNSRILMHTSGALMYPYISFADMMLNGEQLRQPLAETGGRYLDVLPLESLRVEYRGEHSGLAPFLIPELATPEGFPHPELTAVPQPTKEMLALALLHDVGIWPIYCHVESVEAVRVAQKEFRTSEARFLPYWEDGGPVSGTDGLLASAWIRPDGVLLVLVNRERQELRGTFRPRHGSWRGLTGAADALSGEALPRNGDAVEATVPPRGFRLLRLSSGRRRGEVG